MDRDAFSRVVQETMEAVRASLGAIESAAQEADDADLHALARGYAGLLAPLRDFLAASGMGRPLPRTLSRRLEESMAALMEHEERIRALSLHPDLHELAELARLAAALS